MYEGKYFRVKNPIETSRGRIREGIILYCVDEDIHYVYFKNTITATLCVKLKTEQVTKYLAECNHVDKLNLFLIHNKSILNAVLPSYDYLPTAGKYVIDDLKLGKIENAFYALETDIDKIRYSCLGEQLRLHCIVM